MFAVPSMCGLQWKTSNAEQPGNNIGISVTPGQNTKGSWTAILSALANEACFVEVLLYNNNVSAQIRDALVDVGVDPAGGTSYQAVIPDLLIAGVPFLPAMSPFYFPLRIPAGATVAVRAAVNNATVATIRAYVRVWGRPTRPEMFRVGSYVTAIGATAASSNGQAVTPGNATKGAYGLIGTPTKPHWWWQLGVGIGSATLGGLQYFAEIASGDGTNKDIIVPDVHIRTGADESVSTLNRPFGCIAEVDGGVNIYGRAEGSSAPDSNFTMMAYGLGG